MVINYYRVKLYCQRCILISEDLHSFSLYLLPPIHIYHREATWVACTIFDYIIPLGRVLLSSRCRCACDKNDSAILPQFQVWKHIFTYKICRHETFLKPVVNFGVVDKMLVLQAVINELISFN